MEQIQSNPSKGQKDTETLNGNWCILKQCEPHPAEDPR